MQIAFERQIALCVAALGVYDVFEPWWAMLPQPLQDRLDAGDRKAFDRFLAEELRQASAAEDG